MYEHIVLVTSIVVDVTCQPALSLILANVIVVLFDYFVQVLSFSQWHASSPYLDGVYADSFTCQQQEGFKTHLPVDKSSLVV